MSFVYLISFFSKFGFIKLCLSFFALGFISYIDIMLYQLTKFIIYISIVFINFFLSYILLLFVMFMSFVCIFFLSLNLSISFAYLLMFFLFCHKFLYVGVELIMSGKRLKCPTIYNNR